MSQRAKKRRLKTTVASDARNPPAAAPRDRQTPAWRWRGAGICALLVAVVFGVFGQTLGYGFVNYDDPSYVYDNPIIARGLSLDGLRWAFTHVHSSNWHPLTTLLHMADCQLYGLWPGGHHLTNVLLHAATAVLLFLLLLEMTGAMWRAAFVAALFAIHPLRVESVAWVSELKDVLSGLFFMLTLRAYARYARHPAARGSYAMVILWFALGLMSKPILVTTPFLLLLLDYWPLGRLRSSGELPLLLKEKIPFLALSAASSLATLLAQRGAMQTTAYLPLSLRLGNALIATMVYLGKMLYPARLAVLYPLSKGGVPAWLVVDAILLLTALTAGAWLLRRKQPAVLVGWLWYLGMLVPVIGIVQVGQQAYADRYTYLPGIGPCIAATWLAADWAGSGHARRLVLGTVAAVALCALSLAAWHQAAYWRDSETLWLHTLECTTHNSVAHNNLGLAWFQQGRTEEAIAEYRQALRIDPNAAEAHNDLGVALFQQGRAPEALAEYRQALAGPFAAQAHNNLGNALSRQGRPQDAIAEYREALRIKPYYADAIANLGNVLLQQGRTEEAIAQYREALSINPADAHTHNNLGVALRRQGKLDEAIAEYRQALRIDPADPSVQADLNNALLQQAQPK
jgi:tetratricopeptide (TPR) repeat protein